MLSPSSPDAIASTEHLYSSRTTVSKQATTMLMQPWLMLQAHPFQGAIRPRLGSAGNRNGNNCSVQFFYCGVYRPYLAQSIGTGGSNVVVS